MHCLFGISGLKMHTVARAWIAVLEEWNWSFLQKLCVTIWWWLFIVEPRVGTSIDYGGLRFPLRTNVIWNIGYILKSFSLSVNVGFRLRALNPIYFSDLHLCFSNSDFTVKLNISFVQQESQTFLNPHWTIRKPGLCFSSEMIDLFWDLIWDKSLVLSFKIPNL